MLEQKKNNQVTDKPTHIRWRVFGILALASFIAYMLRTNVSIAAPDMMRDIGLDLIQMNWINAAAERKATKPIERRLKNTKKT